VWYIHGRILTPQKEPFVPPRDFLSGEALIQYDNNNLEYFGFGDVTGKWSDVKQVTVTQLSYAPNTERIDPSVTYMGIQPRLQAVGVSFVAQVDNTDIETFAPVVWVTTVINGKWKIDHRLQ